MQRHQHQLCITFIILSLITVDHQTACNEVKGLSQRSIVGNNDFLIKKIYQNNANCSRLEWACSDACRLQFRDRVTGLCVQPVENERCFDIPIRYNYTVDSTDEIWSLLPRYEIISKFPRCWSALGPLLCAAAYRPCSSRNYMETSMNEPGKVELWQVYRDDMCYRALEYCDFLIGSHLWPHFLNCSDTVNRKGVRKLFSDGKCKIGYNKAPSLMDDKQCLWPTIRDRGHFRYSQPLIDDCFLPCRSSLVSSKWLYDSFKLFFFSSCVAVSFLFLACSVYLLVFSLLFLTDLCVYALAHALLSASLHWFLWLLGYFNAFSQLAMCFDHRRRNDGAVKWADHEIGWCITQSWLMHMTILSSFFWLCVYMCIQLSGVKIRQDHSVDFSSSRNLNLRCFLLGNYLIAALLATAGMWLSETEIDGITGVCYKGLVSMRGAMFIYFPILSAIMITLIVVVYLRQRGRMIGRKNKSMSGTNVMKQYCGGEEVALYNVESLGEERITESKSAENGYSAIGSCWLALLCGTTACSIFAALLSHISIVGSGLSEREIVLHSIRCSLNVSINGGQTEWFRGFVHDKDENVLVRRSKIADRFLSAPGCELAAIKDDRLPYIFATFILFPSLPFVFVGFMILFGFCGYGLGNVEKIRDKLSPFILVRMNCDDGDKLPLSIEPLVNSENGINEEQTTSTSLTSIASAHDKSRVRRIDLSARRAEKRRRQSEARYLASVNLHPDSLTNTDLIPGTDTSYLPLVGMRTNTSAVLSNESNLMTQNSVLLSAYQTGLVEGHWRERCSLYASQVKVLTENLQVANQELRRLSTSPLLNQMAAKNTELRPSLVIQNHKKKPADDFGKAGGIGRCNRRTGEVLEQIDEEHSLDCSPKFSALFGSSAVEPVASVNKEAVDGESEKSSKSSNGSDSFCSDEEDSEEERLYYQQMNGTSE